MDKLILTLALLNLIACAPSYRVQKMQNPLVVKSEELKPYIDSFIKDGTDRNAKMDLTNITVILSTKKHIQEMSSNQSTLGVCRIEEFILPVYNVKKNENVDFYFTKKTVLISKEDFEEAAEEERVETIYHEMGHCALNLEHNEQFVSFSNGNAPASIMYPVAIASENSPYYSLYTQNLDYYIDQLFLGTTQAYNENFAEVKALYSYEDENGQKVSVIKDEVHF